MAAGAESLGPDARTVRESPGGAPVTATADRRPLIELGPAIGRSELFTRCAVTEQPFV